MSETYSILWHGIADILASAALLCGVFFMWVGAFGLVRLPDSYNRIHAASKCTTLGLTGMLLAACFHLGDPVTVSKAVITIVFTFVATPAGSHMLAKAAHHGHSPQWDRTLSDELAEDKASPMMTTSDEELETWAPDHPGRTRHQMEPVTESRLGAA